MVSRQSFESQLRQIWQAMVLGNPKGERNVDLDICGEKVDGTESIKTLGVNLDDELNFRDHIRVRK